VILGGGVAAQKENLTAPLKDLVKDMCFGGSHGYIADIVTSALGNDAGIIGAANLVV
jgi:transcriptional regulator/sugar kinase